MVWEIAAALICINFIIVIGLLRKAKAIGFLGDNGKFIRLIFKCDNAVDHVVSKYEKIIEANIEGRIPLKERLKLLPNKYYFPQAGAVKEIKIIALFEEDYE